MTRYEVVDVRYITKVIFLCLTSYLFGNTFGCNWLGILFALYFLVMGCLNSSRRRDFSRRPRYRKLPAYLAIVPLALYWMITPGVENGVNPTMVFLPGLYLLFLTALQERSRGNGGYDAFVNFNSTVVLLASMYQAPRGSFGFFIAAMLLLLFCNSRRGTSWYKYILFLVLSAALGAASFGGWQYWKSHRYGGGSWARENQFKNQVMGFDPVNALGSFNSNFNSKFNNQVVLRIWDEKPPRYMVGARYVTYAGGAWKLPKTPVKNLTPAYYQVDYAVMEVMDSVTRNRAKRVWVQSVLDNFGFAFAPSNAVGFSVKDVDSLQYFSGGMVSGMNKNGNRSDWNYFVCAESPCEIPTELSLPDSTDLQLFSIYEGLLDSVIETMKLREEELPKKDLKSGLVILDKIQNYFNRNFTYSLQVPELDKHNIKTREDPVHVFWRTRRGYCEYFATLSALTLRRLGYPTRYVSGFYNPEVTPGSPYGLFRRKNAHSWVEVYMDNRWVRFDPTPVVVNMGEASPSWLANFWEGTQARFAKWMHYLKDGEWRSSLDSWQAVLEHASDSPWTYVALLLLAGGFAGRRLVVNRRRRSRSISPNSRLAKELAKKLSLAEYQLSRVGLERTPGETVGHFLARIRKEPLEGKSASARNVLEEYEKVRWTL